MPIIKSLLDVDFYKFTMGQMVFLRYPDVRVTYAGASSAADSSGAASGCTIGASYDAGAIGPGSLASRGVEKRRSLPNAITLKSLFTFRPSIVLLMPRLLPANCVSS